MLQLRLSPAPQSDVEKETFRQLVGFYRGTASFTDSGLLAVVPKEEFNRTGLLLSLRSLGISVEEL